MLEEDGTICSTLNSSSKRKHSIDANESFNEQINNPMSESIKLMQLLRNQPKYENRMNESRCKEGVEYTTINYASQIV